MGRRCGVGGGWRGKGARRFLIRRAECGYSLSWQPLPFLLREEGVGLRRPFGKRAFVALVALLRIPDVCWNLEARGGLPGGGGHPDNAATHTTWYEGNFGGLLSI